MLKIHCLLNCFADAIREKYDYRPLYFGVWDTPITVTDEGEITYFSTEIHHQTYIDRFKQLYGDGLEEWYDYKQSKAYNFKRLRSLLSDYSSKRSIILQVDLFYLPYDVRSYGKIHRPHYVFVQFINKNWYIYDPYLDWEGYVEEQSLENAFFKNPFGGGFIIQTEHMHLPKNKDISLVFDAEFQQTDNELARTCLQVLDDISNQDQGPNYARLSTNFTQMEIIAKRKWSYQYAFHYFLSGEAATTEYDQQVEHIVKGFKSLGLLSIRASISKKETELCKMYEKIRSLKEAEDDLKDHLLNLYKQWGQAHG